MTNNWLMRRLKQGCKGQVGGVGSAARRVLKQAAPAHRPLLLPPYLLPPPRPVRRTRVVCANGQRVDGVRGMGVCRRQVT